MSLKNISTSALHARLHQCIGQNAEFYRESCEILVELHSRGEKSPYFRIFPHYREVAAGTLDPLLAMSNLTDRRKTRIAREKVPLETQRAMASAEVIDIAVFSPSNKIVKEGRHIATLNDEQLERALRGGKLRSFQDQKAELEKQQPRKHKSVSKDSIRVEADIRNKELIVGSARIRFSDPHVAAEMAKLGLKVVPLDT